MLLAKFAAEMLTSQEAIDNSHVIPLNYPGSELDKLLNTILNG